jgi:hypothetical protein
MVGGQIPACTIHFRQESVKRWQEPRIVEFLFMPV